MEERSFKQRLDEAIAESVRTHGWLKISEPELGLLLIDQALLWHFGGHENLDDDFIDTECRRWWEFVMSLSGPTRRELLAALRSCHVPLPPRVVERVIG